MTNTPMIALALAQAKAGKALPLYEHECERLAKELLALLAERDALAAKAPMERKLREYKGVTYRDGKFCIGLGRYSNAVSFVWFHRDAFGDEDVAHLIALRDDPYEPIETVEAVLRELANEGDYHRRDASVGAYATRLRAAVAAEMAQGEG